MKRPAIFFDRDNTLICNDGYLADPNQVVLVDGSADAIARLRSFGYVVITFSNQSGVARGMFTEDAVRAVNEKMDQLLLEQNGDAKIDAHEFCPYHPSGTVEEYRQDSELRKPKPGMILKAAEAMDLDLASSWVIGDAPRDIEAGRAAGCRTILFHDPNLSPSEAARHAAVGEPEFAVPSLKRAVDIIQRNTPGLAPPEPAKSEPPVTETKPPPTESQPVDEAKSAATARQQKIAATLATKAAADPRHQVAPSTRPTPASPFSAMPNARLEIVAQQILEELRRQREGPDADFAVSRLLAMIVQILAIATLFISFFNRAEPSLIPIMLLAIFLQLLSLSLWIMSRAK
jgi:D-glycero-D-manno-heptose 1,7-bisphosphate phosphatase